MPSSDSPVDVPSDAAAVARRYRRIERPVSGAIALSVGVAGAAAWLTLPFAWGLAAVLAVALALRLPVLRTEGSARLTTDAPPDAVRAEFAGPTPPTLAFQWGVADVVRSTDDGGRYDLSYLFGLRSVTVATATRPLPDGDGDLELVVTAGGRPWATYAVSIRGRGGTTEVDVEWASDRRFGLRRAPQTLIAAHYREAALAAQGYATVERTASVRP